MNINELEKLADAAMSPAPYEREQGQADLKAVGVPQTIKQLIALCRMQHDALVGEARVHNEQSDAMIEALAAFDAFNNGRE